MFSILLSFLPELVAELVVDPLSEKSSFVLPELVAELVVDPFSEKTFLKKMSKTSKLYFLYILLSIQVLLKFLKLLFHEGFL